MNRKQISNIFLYEYSDRVEGIAHDRDVKVYLEIDSTKKKIRILNEKQEPRFSFQGNCLEVLNVVNNLIAIAISDAKEILRKELSSESNN